MFLIRKASFFFVITLAVFLVLGALVMGTALGLVLATNHNIKILDNMGEKKPALPSQILDINGDLITEFFSEERREIVSVTELPENLIYALLTREDGSFYQHNGFSLGGFSRAMMNNLRNLISGTGYFSGGSTITQQLSGYLYADRTDISLSRKLKELWWAYQLERRFTKEEIISQYMNTMYFGHNTYGVEAASQFFFHHSARENSPAESVMLVIQLAGSRLYSPILQPEAAKRQQENILGQMVESGYIDAEEARLSYGQYWDDYDWSRDNYASAFFERDDKAPFFSEYIRQLLDQYLFGQQDIYRDGYIIHTTLDLGMQREAETQVARGLETWNSNYRDNISRRMNHADKDLTPMIEMLSLVFDLPDIRVAGAQEHRRAMEEFENNITPVLDMVSQVFGVSELKGIADFSYNLSKNHARMNNVETALITLDSETGYILAMIGGSSFSRTNQFNRAMDSKLMPGSAFKPLYYSAAISSRKFTSATRIYDGPTIFYNPDGTPYTPQNYKGQWRGNVLLRTALSKSMNVPAISVLSEIGFDTAIDRAAALLNITDPEEIGRTFDRRYPLGLGIISVAPIQMARAYATIANRGKSVEPLAIRFIEDRNGAEIINPERELREQQARRDDLQILTPQEAYIMVSLLRSTVQTGTLRWPRTLVDGFDGMPIAGKTGTVQNWTDAWTCGFSPYYTTILWAGFDERGNSLGVNQTGATATGPVWARYMKAIHQDLPVKNFYRPETGLVEMEVSAVTGKIVPLDSEEETITEIFLEGTEPRNVSGYQSFVEERDRYLEAKFLNDLSLENTSGSAPLDISPSLDLLLEDLGIDWEGGGEETKKPAGSPSLGTSLLD